MSHEMQNTLIRAFHNARFMRFEDTMPTSPTPPTDPVLAYRDGERLARTTTGGASALAVAQAQGYARDTVAHDMFVHGFCDMTSKIES